MNELYLREDFAFICFTANSCNRIFTELKERLLLIRIRHRLQRYGVAVLAVAIALVIKLLLSSLIKEESPFLLFFAAIIISALYGGIGPGVLATALAALTSDYFFLTPTYSLLSNNLGQNLRLSLFVLEGLLISKTITGLNTAKHRVLLSQEALSQSEERYRLLVDAVQDYAIFLLAPDGCVASWNKGSQRLTGYRADEIIGRHLSCFYPEEDIHSGKPDQQLKVAATEGRFEDEGWRIRKDGSRFWASVVITALKDEAGNLKGFSKVTRDISDRKKAEEARRESEERYRAFIEQSSEGIWRFELEEPLSTEHPETEQIQHFYQYGYLAECNNVMAQMYGFSCAEEIVGARLADFLVQSDPNNIEYLRSFIRSGYRLNAAESHEIDRQGLSKYFLNSLVGIVDNGALVQAWGTQLDITDRKRAHVEREQLLAKEQAARAEAEAANRMKDEFLATLSHELRTPLNAMVGWTQLLRTRKFDEKTTVRALETIDRNTKSLAQLIEDVLDVSRIITGKLRLNVRPVELVPVIEAAIETVLPAAEAKNIRIESILDSSVGSVLGDANRLQQVVWNLLSNAVKFTPKGGRVEMRLEAINSRVQIRVSDTGQGINPDFLPYVFERFRQADSTTTRSYGGLGLGLAIVRHLVELHGGTVDAESPGLGLGATFIVNLPLRAVRVEVSEPQQVQPTAAGEVPTISGSSLDGLRVLVVDDEADARDLLTTVLRQYGAEVTAVATASEALEALKQLKPNVLVSDIGMPEEDGYALIRKVRALDAEQGGRIPAVALTAYARAEDRKQALLAGFQLHVPKPVDPTELAVVVANLTGRTGKV